MAVIKKSEGTTPTEKYLAKLCEDSLLKLWSYPNPVRDDKKELCDLIAVFGNHVLIFFDRENNELKKENADIKVSWLRWKKKAIDKQVKTAHGAERYIQSKRGIFLDQDLKTPFPLEIDRTKMKVHKIIVAHGAREACLQYSDENISGSLAIVYGDKPVEQHLQHPFVVGIDKQNPVHIFDSHNLPIVLGELDTYEDLTAYLDAKLEAIASTKHLIYCGEEDLLAYYYSNYDRVREKNYIDVQSDISEATCLDQGIWESFTRHDIYKSKKLADAESCLWDSFIQKASQHLLNESAKGNAVIGDQNPMLEMAKEPRTTRRLLSQRIKKSSEEFAATVGRSSTNFLRRVTFMESYTKDKAYIFLQMEVGKKGSKNDLRYCPDMVALLQQVCGVAKNRFDHLKKIVGIGLNFPTHVDIDTSEVYLLMNCEIWTDEDRAHYERENLKVGFFSENWEEAIEHVTVNRFPGGESESDNRSEGFSGISRYIIHPEDEDQA